MTGGKTESKEQTVCKMCPTSKDKTISLFTIVIKMGPAFIDSRRIKSKHTEETTHTFKDVDYRRARTEMSV